MVFSHDGSRVITGNADGSVKIWDVEHGKELITLKAHLKEVLSVKFSPDNKEVITKSRNMEKIWYSMWPDN